MESLYKRKGKLGLADREKRKEFNKQKSKAKKEQMIDSKRRMPLGELNVADPAKDEMKAKNVDRLQQLREWQKARQEAKAKGNAAKAKKPTYVLGKPQTTNFNPHINTTGKSSQENNPKVMSNKKSTLPVPITATKPSPSITKQPVGSKKKLDCPGRVQPKIKHVPSVTKTKQPVEKIEQNVQQSKKTRPLAKTQPLPKTQQQPSKAQRPKSAQQPVKKPQQKQKKLERNNKSIKRVTVKQTSSSQAVPVRQSARLTNKTAPVNQSSLPLIVEVPPPPSTPSKKTYMPICPSPLLHSRSATYRANSEPVGIPSDRYVDEPAWVPGASAPEGSVSDKFVEFKDSFSPFKFGTSESNFQFRFQMKNEACDSVNTESHKCGSCEEPSGEGTSNDGAVTELTRVLSWNNLTNASPSQEENEKKLNTSVGKSSGKMLTEVRLTRSPAKGKRRRSRTVLKYEEEEREEEKLQPSDSLMTTSPTRNEGGKEENSVENEAESVGKTSVEICSPSNGKRRRSRMVFKYEEEISEAPSGPEEISEAPSGPEEISEAPSGPEEISEAPSGPEEISEAPSGPEEISEAPSGPEEIPSNTAEASDGMDIPKFRKLHSDVCEKLTSLCEEWEGKMAALEESEGGMEEVLGQLRSTTGYAHLLMKQKLKQYIGLVDTADTQSGHRKTTAQDLQGFWDMVHYQVDRLFKMFADLDDLEKNNWVVPQPSPKKLKLQKNSKSSRKPKKGAATEASNERLQASRKKMVEQRAELKRLTMKARQQAKEEEMANEIVRDGVAEVEEPPKEKEIQPSEALLCENQSCSEIIEQRELPLMKRELDELVYPSPLRRSTRIRNRSVFSPMCSPVLSAKRQKVTPRKESHQAQEAVPTGLLITF